MHDEEHWREAAEQHNHPLKAHAADQVEIAVRSILESVGEDPERDGLKDTPARVARMYEELLQGYHTDPIARMVTSAVLGRFKSDARTRSEFFEHIRKREE